MTPHHAGSERIVRAEWELRPRDGGYPVRGDLRAPQGPPPSSAVVVCHGFKGFRHWGFFPFVARHLARAGHAVLTFDLSGNGVGDDGEPFTALDRFAAATHSRNVDEIRMVLDAVTSGPLFPRPPHSIGLLGHSRGGGEAILAASEHGGIDALVTWSAISRVERWSAEDVEAWRRGETTTVLNSRTGQQLPISPAWWRDATVNRERLDVLRAAGTVDAPWLIVHGAADETVPVDEARALHRAAGQGAELLLVDGAGHTFGATHPMQEPTSELLSVMNATARWFANHLVPRAPL